LFSELYSTTLATTHCLSVLWLCVVYKGTDKYTLLSSALVVEQMSHLKCHATLSGGSEAVRTPHIQLLQLTV